MGVLFHMRSRASPAGQSRRHQPGSAHASNQLRQRLTEGHITNRGNGSAAGNRRINTNVLIGQCIMKYGPEDIQCVSNVGQSNP